jgi:DNA-binding transcriptional ArsR family regulator
MALGDIRRIVESLLATRPAVTSGEVARAARISRQAVHRHLTALVAAGDLMAEGAGRGARYRRAAEAPVHRRYLRRGLDEDRVWNELRATSPLVGGLAGDAGTLFHYAFTEMLNNAVDHSGSNRVEVEFERAGARIAFEVSDEGLGVFERVRRGLELETRLAALQELSKGKVTTQPEQHTGEGIFFVSKAADLFELDSGGLRWIVDNVRGDVAVGEAAARKGTRVRFEADPARARPLADLFAEYTDDFAFAKTRAVVKLFAIGTSFISRSEAKRLVHGLERFREVILDFRGVEVVGQGFADEVFRVWARAHRRTRLTPVEMSRTVAFVVERARSGD